MDGTVTHEKSDLNFVPTLVGMLGLIAFVFVVFVISMYYYKASTTGELTAKDAQGRPIRLEQIREKSRKELSQFGWANESKTVVRVPIESAMKIVVRDYNNR